MPRPHYPAQGGPHRAAWNPSEARKPHRVTVFSSRPSQAVNSREFASGKAASDAELSGGRGNGLNAASPGRHHPEQPSYLPGAPRPDTRTANGFHTNKAVLGIAVLLCLMALLFALVAILTHG